MPVDDFIIDDAAVHFGASKSVEYRKRVTERFTIFIHFLQANSLTAIDIVPFGERVTGSTKIRRSHLTDEGMRVVELGYADWLRAADEGKPIADLSVLEKALLEIRAGHCDPDRSQASPGG
jgi:hypothetical protein